MPGTENLSALLPAFLGRKPLPGKLLLHGLLGRICAPRAGALHGRLREPLWWNKAAEIEQRFRREVEDPIWVAAFASEIASIPEDVEPLLLVTCAAALQALDAYHRERRIEVERAVTELPPAMGGGQIAFLPPPEAPIAARVPPGRSLPRGPGDLRNDLRTVLSLWWYLVDLSRHAVKPCFDRLKARISGELSERFHTTGDLRVALASPFAELDFEVQADPSRLGARGTPYRFLRIRPASLDTARAALEQVIAACAEHQIDLLCFPELTLDTPLRAHLQHLLAAQNASLHPALVMAGSFHVDGDEGLFNRCRVLDGHGNVLFAQDKCVAYGIPASQAALMQGDLLARLGIDERGGYEDIALGRTLQVLDFSLGRLVAPICLDFCGDELRDLLIDCAVNFCLVPAMTPEMTPFQRRAYELGTWNRATTFVVNSSWLARQIGLAPEHLAHAYVPVRGHRESARHEICEAVALFSIRELLDLS